jgi:competence ComEA-like helix-hairpin-helix protein
MFELTQEERRVILFLVSIALVGVGINFLAKRYAPIKAVASINQNIGKININKADKEALVSIPGIGEKLAGRIIEYRSQNRQFASLEELQNIKGLKGDKLDRLKQFIFIE